MRYFKTIGIVLPILLTACSCVSGQRSKSNSKPHYESLTDNRLKFPAVTDTVLKTENEPEVEFLPAKQAVTEQVNGILDSIARFNKARLFIDGYTIQIYSGLKKEEAMNSIKRMKEVNNGMTPELHYFQPKWVVKYGSYFTRMEAQRDLQTIRMFMPTVILVPDKVALK